MLESQSIPYDVAVSAGIPYRRQEALLFAWIPRHDVESPPLRTGLTAACNANMRPPHEQQQGLVAILDALGAAAYTDLEIARFLDSRALVLQALNQKAEAVLGSLKADMISTFTFNDTILIVLKLPRVPNIRDVKGFFLLLRKFLIDSLTNRILFRGAVSVGSFYLNEDTNSVMGEAVTDAAAWYDRADWIGVHATPRASIFIDQLLESGGNKQKNLVVDYEVPMKDKSATKLKAVNWPRAYFVPSLSPCSSSESRRGKLLESLGMHRIPLGCEGKYFHTIAFYDFIVKSQELNKLEEHDPSKANQASRTKAKKTQTKHGRK